MPEDNFRIYRLHGEDLTLAASGRISETIDAVLAAHFTGTQPVPQAGHAPLSEVVFYDAGNGKLSLYRGLPGTKLEHVKRHSMSSRWDILVAGNFKGGFANEIVLYDRQDGTSKFIQFTADGDIVELAKHDWTDRWDIIVAGRFGGFSQDDLLFYDRDSGRLKIQECRDAQLTELLIDTTIEPGWDVIVAGRFITSAVRTPLFFYRASTGQGRLYELGVDGQFKPVKNYSDLPKHRDVCVAGDFVTRGAPDQVLLYDRDTGAATVYAFLHPNQALQSVMEFELPRHVHAVVPCNLVEAAPGRDLIMAGVHNKAVYLGWGAYLDLAINFNEFFDADHTVMCWFMPQFVHANYQPVIAENGGGTYIVGLAAYGRGNVVFNKDAGADFNNAGDPVLYVKIGNAERIYLAPEAGDGTWIHLALVRKGNRFSLFLNGVLKKPVTITRVTETVEDDDGNEVDVTKDKVVEPDTELEVPGISFDRKPSGTLRIGRRTTGTSESKLLWQAYGLVDDIAVFTQALTAANLQSIIASRRLAVTEDMIACWPLDFPGSGAGSPPSKLRPYTRSTRPGPMLNVQPIPVPVIVPVSAGRSSDYDSRLFSDPGLIKQCHAVVRPPFETGQAIRVTQGMASVLGSHTGSSAFYYDLKLHTGGTGNKPVYACVKGRVLEYKQDYEVTDKREKNFVRIQYADTRTVGYLHMAKGSLNDVITGGTPDPGDQNDDTDDRFVFTNGDGPELNAGDFVANVGPIAKHVHFGARAAVTPDLLLEKSIAIPLAFRDIEIQDPVTKKWNPPVGAAFVRDGDVFRQKA